MRFHGRTFCTTTINAFASIVVFLFCLSAQATSLSLSQIRLSVKQETMDVVSGLDGDALVTVELIPEVRPKTRLPGTNVILDEVLLTDENGTPQIKSIEINLLTSLKELPKSAEDIIRKQAGSYSKEIKLNVQSKIAGFKKTPDKQIPINLEPVTNSFTKLNSSFGNLNTSVTSFNSAFDSFNKKIEALGSIAEAFTQKISIALFAVSGTIGLLLFALIDISRQNRKQIKAVITGTQGLVQALESQGGGANAAQLPASNTGSQSMGSLASSNDSDLFSEMSDAGIAAIISDAYWCEQDGYAASVWRRLPTGRKQVLLNGLTFARPYATYLSSIQESEDSWEQHPYYLNPLPIWNVSNKDIALQIKEHPGLIAALPPMRISALPMNSSDILALKQLTSGTDQNDVPDLSNIAPSEMRPLSTTVRILSRNDEDDQKLLAIQNVSIADMEQIVSLVWIMQVDTEKLKNAIKSIAATDLASAWIGPPQVLQKLESAIADKKLKIVKSYADKIRPSRKSSAYELLHQIIVNELKKSQIKPANTDSNQLSFEKSA